MTDQPERILFITGRLAAPIVRDVVSQLGGEVGFDHHVVPLNVSVAALLTTRIVARRLNIDRAFDRAILPGWCRGELEPLSDQFGFPFERGPKNIHDLPRFFGNQNAVPVDLSRFDIEILAEINHVPRLSDTEILRQANDYRASGADVIDLGCEPGSIWKDARRVVRLLVQEGFRVSIDSFEQAEVIPAVEAGAELVLSCNSTNVDWAGKLPVELVVIPDDPRDILTLDPIITQLREWGTQFRIDPILEPIGLGFANSLVRYAASRKRWPDIEIMMGIGNVTELTEVDSAGVNAVLAGTCQELGIRSVLTTEVINWCRTAVKEFDLARRLMKVAVAQQIPPKHLTSELVILRDPTVPREEVSQIEQMREQIRDCNFRIFVAGGELHMINADGHWHGDDPYEVFDRALAGTAPIDAPHAFYLGYELAKATTALTLGKRYTQDEALSWGFLTRAEASAQERRRLERGGGGDEGSGGGESEEQ